MSSYRDLIIKEEEGFIFVYWHKLAPKDIVVTTTMEKALEKKKNKAMPMTYINLSWKPFGTKRVIILTAKLPLFGISRSKNTENIEQDRWSMRWRLEPDLENYNDQELRAFHTWTEEVDNEIRRQLLEAAKNKNNSRSYKGLIRCPENSSDYMYTVGQLGFDKDKDWLRDFTLIKVKMTAAEWEDTQPSDLAMSKYSEQPEKYSLEYVPFDKRQVMPSAPNYPTKDEYKDLVPTYASGVLYMELGSVSFNASMIVVAPKILRCLYFSEPRARTINNDIIGNVSSSSATTNAAAPVTNKDRVRAVNLFGDDDHNEQEETVTAPTPATKRPVEDTEETAPPAKKPKVVEEETAVVAEAPAAVAAKPAAVKVSSSLGASAAKPASASAAKPSSSSSSSSSAAPAAVKKVVAAPSGNLKASLGKL